MAFIMASIIAGGATLAGGIVNGVVQGNAAHDAADKQAQAARDSNALQERMYNQTRDDQEPWRIAGGRALSDLGNSDFQKDFTLNDFQQDPGYQFRMDQGQKALERSAAAKGGLMNGGTMKALAEYGQGFASNEYNNAYNRFNSDRDRRFNRLSSLAGIGQTANSQLGAAGSNYAGNVGNTLMSNANAQGAAGMASANAWGGGISNGLSGIGRTWMDAQMMNKMFPTPKLPNGGGEV
jgi:hypothetical protein